nr:MAG TPA: TBP-associated factor [Caudoviricetes sp.]
MMNPMQLMQMIRGGGNPQKAIINMMKQQSGNNPVIDNAINMMEKGDNAGIEKLARNLCKERNINPDDILSQVKNQFGIK